jgi:hypothetical protein
MKVLSYKPEGRGFKARLGERFLSISLIFPTALDTGVYSATSGNECQKQKNIVSGE